MTFAIMLTVDEADRDQYEKLRDEALRLQDMITDDFYAAYGRHQIIRSCLAAGEIELATSLLAEVRDEFVLDDILDEFPDLRAAPAPNTLPDPRAESSGLRRPGVPRGSPVDR